MVHEHEKDGEVIPTKHESEKAQEQAERAIRGEHSAVPPSDLADGRHEQSHAAHLEILHREIGEKRPTTKPEGDARDENYPGNRRRP